MPDPKPLAFMSYVRLDDEHEEGRLSKFRERLSAEVRMQTGEGFPIFQDREDIAWGQNWKERIEESLDEVTFLIPIVTPGFFKSAACRDEVERFLEREKRLGRNDLILPVYYVGCPVLDDEAKRANDTLALAISDHNWADWRELRFEPLTSPQVRKTLAQLAVEVRDALERVGPTVEPAASRRKRAAAARRRPGPARAAAQEPSIEGTETTRRPSPKTEPPTRVVDPMHRGDFPTITEAIEAAEPGDRILVRPGLYQESLVIDKPLEIVGDGALGEVVVQGSGANTVLFRTTMGRIANLSLRQMGDGRFVCVRITQGRLELEDCDITSQSLTGVVIDGGADPRLRRNRIHDGKQSGVLVQDNGQGTLEDNDIFGNAYVGVAIKTGGDPTLRRNRIHDGKEGGVLVYDNGQGTLEDNDIFGNGLSGVEIKEGGNPTVRRNQIHDSRYSGVLVQKNGQGILEDNDITGNALNGVATREGGDPIVRRNRINDNHRAGVHVYGGGRGTIQDNDLRGNVLGALDISEDSAPNVKLARNLE